MTTALAQLRRPHVRWTQRMLPAHLAHFQATLKQGDASLKKHVQSNDTVYMAYVRQPLLQAFDQCVYSLANCLHSTTLLQKGSREGSHLRELFPSGPARGDELPFLSLA